jgi:hypothetical protein
VAFVVALVEAWFAENDSVVGLAIETTVAKAIRLFDDRSTFRLAADCCVHLCEVCLWILASYRVFEHYLVQNVWSIVGIWIVDH